MIETELTPSNLPEEQIIAALESFASERCLQFKRYELKTYPGSAHWHFTKPGFKGVLELTYYPKKNRLWLKQQAGRKGEWIEAEVIAFQEKFS